jgi:hypothetical protein
VQTVSGSGALPARHVLGVGAHAASHTSSAASELRGSATLHFTYGLQCTHSSMSEVLDCTLQLFAPPARSPHKLRSTRANQAASSSEIKDPHSRLR